MPLGNPRSIVGHTILLFNSLHNLVLMISRCNWFLGIVFLTAAFGALINPSLYIAISLLFFLIGLLLLPPTDKLTCSYSNQRSPAGTFVCRTYAQIVARRLATRMRCARCAGDWQIRGGIKATVILASLITICLIVPQVETNTAIFMSPVDSLKNQTRLS